MKTGKTKIGLIGLGLDTYWPQFEGLYTRLCGYQDWRCPVGTLKSLTPELLITR